MKKLLFTVIGLFFILTVKAQSPDEIPFPNPPKYPDKYGIYSYCDHEPTFPGGLKIFYKFLTINLKLPDKTEMMDMQGKVLISFVVEKSGILTNIKVVRSLQPAFDNEAIRVLKKSPKWRPGIVHGRKVRARYVMSIPFQPSPE